MNNFQVHSLCIAMLDSSQPQHNIEIKHGTTDTIFSNSYINKNIYHWLPIHEHCQYALKTAPIPVQIQP